MPDIKKFYAFHGITLSPQGDQLIGDCAFCGKLSHFFVAATEKSRIGGKRTTPGMWECKACGEMGNEYSFLNVLLKKSSASADLSSLAKERGISVVTLGHAGICRSITTGKWLIPTWNVKQKLSNLYQASRNKEGKLEIRSSPAPCQQQLYRINTIKDYHESVWICEGHWDTLVRLEMFSFLAERPTPSGGMKMVLRGRQDFSNPLLRKHAVVGVPGASTFKDPWLEPIKGKKAILIFDNDDGGQKGCDRLTQKLLHAGIPVRRVVWDDIEENDLRDLYQKE